VAVTVTPYNAGHLLGGCVWRIVAGYADGRGGGLSGTGSEEEVVYAVDWCHKKERCVCVMCACARARVRMSVHECVHKCACANVKMYKQVLVKCFFCVNAQVSVCVCASGRCGK